jgi:hypothetical protein
MRSTLATLYNLATAPFASVRSIRLGVLTLSFGTRTIRPCGGGRIVHLPITTSPPSPASSAARPSEKPNPPRPSCERLLPQPTWHVSRDKSGGHGARSLRAISVRLLLASFDWVPRIRVTPLVLPLLRGRGGSEIADPVRAADHRSYGRAGAGASNRASEPRRRHARSSSARRSDPGQRAHRRLGNSPEIRPAPRKCGQADRKTARELLRYSSKCRMVSTRLAVARQRQPSNVNDLIGWGTPRRADPHAVFYRPARTPVAQPEADPQSC